jgi:hypothetical protein
LLIKSQKATTDWEKIFIEHIFDERLVSRIYNELLIKKNYSPKKGQKNHESSGEYKLKSQWNATTEALASTNLEDRQYEMLI